MKMLFINSFYAPHVKGGAEITLEIITRGMASRGHEVSVLSLSQTDEWATESRDGIDITRMPTPNLHPPYTYKPTSAIERYVWKLVDCYNPKAHIRISSLLSQKRPDIVFTHNLAGISIAAWQACRLHKVPVMHVLHDYYLLCPNVNMMNGGTTPCGKACTKCKLLRWPHHYASSQLDAVVGVSRSILKQHEDAGYFTAVKEKHVIYNARDIVAGQTRLPKSAGPLVFGFIGGLSPVKGVDQLIRSFQKIAVDRNIKLTIAGAGEPAYEQSLRAAAGPAVEFLGYVPSADFYARIDVLVVPSLWHEPLGSVVFESLAHGLPVIGTLRGGMPEMIRDGVNGLLYEPSDESNLVTAMQRILNDAALLQVMRDNAASSASHFNNLPRMVGEYETVAARIHRPVSTSAAKRTTI
jgi:glycosyltransferase involved in cell wall biosynthesis